MIRHAITTLGSLCFCLSLMGCATAPVTDFRDNTDIASLNADQQRMWDAAGRLNDTIRKRRLVYQDPALTAYLQSVLDRLYPEFAGTLKVKPFNSPHLNAFCLPNGHIYFNIGLLARLDNEAQLATVLAHEAAHFIHQHSLQRRNSADGAVMIGLGFEVLTGIPFSGSLLASSVLSGYSQAHENEADEQGFARLVESGYDPREAPKTFQKLLDEVEALDIDEPFMFASHPKLSSRIENFNRLLAQLDTPDGIRNADDYHRLTGALRERTLQRYLDMNNDKILLLILNNQQLRTRYTRHPDYYLGEAYRLRNEEGDNALAIEAFENSIRNNATFAPPRRALGLLMMKQGNKQRAIENFSSYLSLQPDAPDRGYIETYLQQLGS